jgi:hypothetical protein
MRNHFGVDKLFRSSKELGEKASLGHGLALEVLVFLVRLGRYGEDVLGVVR